jgi:hypothetical protein
MAEALEERIQRAIVAGKEARSAYYKAILLPDEQILGPPASEAQLRELETRLNKPLPPSYRVFLSLCDGWRMVAGGVDLLSIQDMLYGPRADRITKWQHQMARSGDSVAANSLVIGDSTITPTKLLLDPDTVDANGEWAVVQHHKDEEVTYPSFLAWLEESVDEFRELLQLEGEGKC